MSPEVQSRAFEPLFSTRTEGTGLGLPIALRIATAHGGSIEIESRPESGTRVTVRLPAAHTS
jgi:two-component system sensor histidine kinase FlrB